MELQHTHTILVILIGIVYPIYSIVTGNDSRKMMLESSEKKIYVLKYTIVFQLILAFLIVGSIIINNDSVGLIGLSFIDKPLWVVGLFATCFFVLWLLNRIEIPEEKKEKLIAQYKDIMFVVPASHLEYIWTILVSFIAGTFEEIIFRGFLFWQLQQYMPMLPAIIVTNIAFAAAHYMSKMKNMVMTFILGITFSIVYSLSGSLWLSILLHIAVDMYSTTMAKKVFAFKE